MTTTKKENLTVLTDFEHQNLRQYVDRHKDQHEGDTYIGLVIVFEEIVECKWFSNPSLLFAMEFDFVVDIETLTVFKVIETNKGFYS